MGKWTGTLEKMGIEKIMHADKSFWNGKKVLVTGHTGFVGAWMCAVLKYMGADIYGIALEAEHDSLYEQIRLSLSVTEYIQDIIDYEKVKRILDEVNPEIVIHLAAFGFVKECYEIPMRAYQTNVLGTMNLLEVIRSCDSVSNILIVSSDKVYQNDEEIGRYFFRENEKLGGIDPYSCSKTCEDLIAQSYYHTYYKDTMRTMSIVRPGNILGGGDHIKSRLIPSMLDKFQKNEVVDIRHPNATRPWQHVLDAIDAYLTIIQKTFAAEKGMFEIYNVGPEKDGQMSVGEIAKYISDKFEHSNVQLGNGNEGVQEAEYLGVDITKIKQQVLWQPKKNMKDILEDCYNFWKQGQTQDKYILCLQQIEEYYNGENEV